jgi:hypothetical protein
MMLMMEEALGLSGLFYRLSVQDLGDSFPEIDVQEETRRQELAIILRPRKWDQ